MHIFQEFESILEGKRETGEKRQESFHTVNRYEALKNTQRRTGEEGMP